MWTIEVVKMRFAEAADVERRIAVKGGPKAGGNAWPTYCFDAEDMNGWDDQARADNLEAWQGRKVTKSPEVTRWEEVLFQWTPLVPLNRRGLVWEWARCIASGRSFSKWCQQKGLVRQTAYNRLERIFQSLVFRFRNEVRVLRHSEGDWSLQDSPDLAPISTMMAIRDNSRAIKFTSAFRTEDSRDLIHTDQDAEGFALFLEERNKLCRVEQERREDRRRRKLGIMEEAA